MSSAVFVINSIPKKTSKGSMLIVQPRRFLDIKLSVQLRRLLILVDGSKSVPELLGKGITGVSEELFDTLLSYGLIDFPSSDAAAMSVGYTQEMSAIVSSGTDKNFTTIRYVLLDALIDLSMKDFAVRPWIDRFESAVSVAHLQDLVAEFAMSKEGRMYDQAASELEQLVR